MVSKLIGFDFLVKVVVTLIVTLVMVEFLLRPINYSILPKRLQWKSEIGDIFYANEYALELSTQRINKLFAILHEKEKNLNDVFSKLGILMFENLINGKEDLTLDQFEQEKKQYLKIVDDKIEVTKEFIDYLYSISNNHSYIKPRNNVMKYELVRTDNLINLN